jgi:hypothetical protein
MTISRSETIPTEAKTPCVKKWFPQARRIQGGLTRQDICLDGQSNYLYQGIVVEKAIHLLSSFGQLQLFNPKSALDSPTPHAKERGRIFT